MVQLVDTRRSERRAHSGLGVRLSPWSLVLFTAGAAGAQLALIRPVSPVRFRGLRLGLDTESDGCGRSQKSEVRSEESTSAFFILTSAFASWTCHFWKEL